MAKDGWKDLLREVGLNSAAHKQQLSANTIHYDIGAPPSSPLEPSDKENFQIMCSVWGGDDKVLVKCPKGTKPVEWKPLEGEGSFPYGNYRVRIMIHVLAVTEKESAR